MPDSIVALELAEIEALTDLYRAAPAGVVTDCGLSVKEIGDAVLIAASRFDVLALNRLVGLGLRSSPDEAIAEAMTVIEQTGSPRCFVPVAPTGASDGLGASSSSSACDDTTTGCGCGAGWTTCHGVRNRPRLRST